MTVNLWKEKLDFMIPQTIVMKILTNMFQIERSETYV